MQTKFLHPLYRDNISVDFGNHIFSPKILGVLPLELVKWFENALVTALAK